ncbi:glycosyl transferase family 1 [Sphingomonas sp. Leaf339]|uniref:GT4 family glycosyltransferase PelF n=1 Tax=Sphingomonas sp. Leaf339 TaxID=1736343 RepID=UPI0006F2F34E|nr:GT4 family glycosyltransferase PelF [Sphingomonas sp. Leaf339]KQU57221.1 glycosyl transferase family 1 [Sphingomonas sp. Leaf339]
MTGSPHADVCLIVEGAYPYVVGGVANWLQDLIGGLPDCRFAIVAIKPDATRMPWRLQPPSNVVSVTEVSLAPGLDVVPRRRRPADVAVIAEMLLAFLEEEGEPPLAALFAALTASKHPWTPAELLTHPVLFQAIVAYAERTMPSASFHHVFWATRTLLGGLLAALLTPLPIAARYHTISTGFAGLIAARAVIEHRAPAMITEHGIYLLERQIEIMMADWIGSHAGQGLTLDADVPGLRELWRRAFRNYARLCYDHCDPIIALYAANNAVQARLGAAPERLRVIPNGIYLDRFAGIAVAQNPEKPLVALIGRVVPIKDIKTFIRAAAIAHHACPTAEFAILGPLDEDGDYYDECRALVTVMGMDKVIRFTGRVRVDEWLPRIDVVVLTSLSEAQPLVILEAGAFGIPVVAPDVGSCREMLEGAQGDDAHGGIITPLVDPEATGKAIINLLADPARRTEFGKSLRDRVKRDYDQTSVIARYRKLYLPIADGPSAAMWSGSGR